MERPVVERWADNCKWTIDINMIYRTWCVRSSRHSNLGEHFNGMKSIWWFFDHSMMQTENIQCREWVSWYWFVQKQQQQQQSWWYFHRNTTSNSRICISNGHCYRAAAIDATDDDGASCWISCSRRNACLNDALALNIMWKQLQKNHQMFLCPSREIS